MTYETSIAILNTILLVLGSITLGFAISCFIKKDWEEGLNNLLISVFAFVLAYL